MTTIDEAFETVESALYLAMLDFKSHGNPAWDTTLREGSESLDLIRKRIEELEGALERIAGGNVKFNTGRDASWHARAALSAPSKEE